MICGKCLYATGRPAEDWEYCLKHKKMVGIGSTCEEYISSRVIVKSGMRAPRYSIIYADPPWDGLGWNKAMTGHFCPAKHYSVMSDEQIIDLPIDQLAEENCALFLWVTYPNLRLSLDCFRRWGFRYASQAFTWAKQNPTGVGWHTGLGSYTRANAEICLLGMKGSLRVVNHDVPSLIVEPRREHSRKPDCARDRIINLFGALNRIELFCRFPEPGWDHWGNEVDSEIIIK